MTWSGAIAALRRELRAYVDAKVAGVAVWTRTANASKLGQEDAVETGDDDSNRGQRPVRRVEPFGLRSRPPAKQRCLSLRIGSSTVVYIGVASDGGYGPGDLEDGETALYCKAGGTEVRLDKDGNVKIDAASGKDVIVNAGTAKVSRVGDDLSASTALASWASAVEAGVAAGGGGTIAPNFAAAAGVAGGLGTIHSGADRFKG